MDYGLDELEEFSGSKTELYYENIKSGVYGSVVTGGYRFPGHGFKYDRCGKKGIKLCSQDHIIDGGNNHIISMFTQSCGKLSCPICFKKTIDRQATKIKDRISIGIALEKHNGRKRVPFHLVVSPPPERYDKLRTVSSIKKEKQYINKMVKRIGLTGCTVIFHMYRYEDKEKQKPFFSPHFHLIGIGWLDYQKIIQNYKQTGYVIKKVTKPKKTKGMLITNDDIFGLAKYLLSHCAIHGTKTSYQFWGSLSNNKFKSSHLLAFESNDDTGYMLHKLREQIFNSTENQNRYKSTLVKYVDGRAYDAEEDSTVKTGDLTYSNFIPKIQQLKEFISLENNDIRITEGHRDYPAFPKNTDFSETKTSQPDMIRPPKIQYLLFIYVVKKDKVSPFVVDFSLSQEKLCHICFHQLRLAIPRGLGGTAKPIDLDFLSDVGTDVQIPVPTGMFELMRYDVDMETEGVFYIHDNFTTGFDYSIPSKLQHIAYTFDENLLFNYKVELQTAKHEVRSNLGSWYKDDTESFTDDFISRHAKKFENRSLQMQHNEKIKSIILEREYHPQNARIVLEQYQHQLF